MVDDDGVLFMGFVLPHFPYGFLSLCVSLGVMLIDTRQSSGSLPIIAESGRDSAYRNQLPFANVLWQLLNLADILVP